MAGHRFLFAFICSTLRCTILVADNVRRFVAWLILPLLALFIYSVFRLTAVTLPSPSNITASVFLFLVILKDTPDPSQSLLIASCLLRPLPICSFRPWLLFHSSSPPPQPRLLSPRFCVFNLCFTFSIFFAVLCSIIIQNTSSHFSYLQFFFFIFWALLILLLLHIHLLIFSSFCFFILLLLRLLHGSSSFFIILRHFVFAHPFFFFFLVFFFFSFYIFFPFSHSFLVSFFLSRSLFFPSHFPSSLYFLFFIFFPIYPSFLFYFPFLFSSLFPLLHHRHLHLLLIILLFFSSNHHSFFNNWFHFFTFFSSNLDNLS